MSNLSTLLSSPVLFVLAKACAVFMTGLFATAGIRKLMPRHRQYYLETVQNYDLAPANWSAALALLAGVTEVFIAVLIIMPATQVMGLGLAAGLLFLYLFAFAAQIKRGNTAMDCGCAGPAGQITIGVPLLLRNAFLIVLCGFALCFSDVASVSCLLNLLAAGIVALIYLSIEQLIANHQRITALRNSTL